MSKVEFTNIAEIPIIEEKQEYEELRSDSISISFNQTINSSIVEDFMSDTPQKFQSSLDKKESSESSETISSEEENDEAQTEQQQPKQQNQPVPLRRIFTETLYEEINDYNARYFKKVSERTTTGKLINSIFKVYHRDRKKQRTRFRGNLFALFYIPDLLRPCGQSRIAQLNNRLGGFSADEPILSIGPDWIYSLLAFITMNVGVSSAIAIQPLRFKFGIMYGLNLLLHILWNFFFLVVCLWNPGLAPRNPEIHETSYLAGLAQKNLLYCICKDCKLIHRHCNDGLVYHCQICNVCVESQENHFKVFGKCIGKGNRLPFFVVVMLSLAQLYTFIYCILNYLKGEHINYY